ncbi:MAG: biopolymer transporter ExbD [Luteimonas sp.]|nr:biopolymer transporter ExbD [Luteimonas sp.]
MAFSRHDPAPRSIAEMNITPLVDVMLVLLVIFMVTAPTLSKPITFALPQPIPPEMERPLPPELIDLRIAASGEVYWNDSLAPLSALPALMRAEIEGHRDNPPRLQIDANGDSDYQSVAKVMALAKNAGMTNIAFVRK